MNQGDKCRPRPMKAVFRCVFYVCLIILLYYLILPFTSFYYNHPFFTPFSYRLNHRDIILSSGDSMTLHLAGFHKKISYSSTDFKVAEVTRLGKVVAKRTGTAIIKVKVNGHVSKCRVRVVNLNYDSIHLKIGDSKKLRVLGFRGRVKWKSSNQKIVSVTRGKVLAKKRGRVKITASIKGKKLYCTVIVP